MGPRLRHRLAAPLAVTAAFLVAPAAASAATAYVTGSGDQKVLHFDAAPGEMNDIGVGTVDPGVVRISDVYNDITPGPGCESDVASGPRVVQCPSGSLVRGEFDLGDRDDRFTGGGDLPVTVDGGPGDDQLTGGDGADTLDGGPGDDWFDAAFDRGADTYAGGDGNDTISYDGRWDPLTITLDGVADDGSASEHDNVQPDVERVIGGYGDDTITGSDAPNVIDGGQGVDTLSGGGGNDTLDSGQEPDAGCSAGSLSGDAGDDVLIEYGGANVSGGSGDDKIRVMSWCASPPAVEEIHGDAGHDLVDYSALSNSVDVSLDDIANDGARGNENVHSDVEDVTGGYGYDVLVGDGAANVLNGGAGDDVLDGGGGPDTLRGGAGEDLADYSGRTAPVDVSLDDRANDGEAGEGDDVASDVEDITGGSGNDVLTGDAADNVLDGGGGADTLRGGAGEDLADYSGRIAPVDVSLDDRANDGEAGEGDDVASDVEDIAGGSGNDVLTGDAADNVLDGGPGADRMSGGAGTDAVDYSARTQPVIADLSGSPGNDGEAGEGDTIASDVEGLYGGSGDDTLTGNVAGGFLDGGDGADHLIDPGGADDIAGGAGDDVIAARDGALDHVACGNGSDSATVDAADVVELDCEWVDAPAPARAPSSSGAPSHIHRIPPVHLGPTPTSGAGHAPPAAAPDRTPPRASVRVLSSLLLPGAATHRVVVRVHCSERCSATARLRRRGARNPAAGAVAPRALASTWTLRLRWNPSAARALRRAGCARLVLDVVVADAHGNRRDLREDVLLRHRAPPHSRGRGARCTRST